MSSCIIVAFFGRRGCLGGAVASKVAARGRWGQHIPSQSVDLALLRFRAQHEALVEIVLVDASKMMAARSPLCSCDLDSRGG